LIRAALMLYCAEDIWTLPVVPACCPLTVRPRQSGSSGIGSPVITV